MTDSTPRAEPLAAETESRPAQSVQAREPLSLAATCLIAVGFGLFFGFLEVGVKILKYHYDGVFFEWSNPDAFWMIPTAQAALFLLLALALFLAGRATRHGLSLKALLIALITVGTLSAFLGLKRTGIHDVAKLVFSLGVGVAVGRAIDRRPRAVVRFAAAACLILAPIALARAVWLHGVQRVQERHQLATLPAPTQTLPNVLLIVLDTVRALSLELYGYPCTTMPNLTRFAQSGVVFDRAWSVAPWTLPSHASLFTGRWYTELSTDWLHTLDAQYPTLAELLNKRGYATGGFVANLLFTTRITGLDRGFLSYRDHELNLKTWLQSAEMVKRITKWTRKLIPGAGEEEYGRKYATTVNREFLHWLEDVGDRPYFAFLNYFDAHEPYEQFAGFSPKGTAPDSVLVAPGRQRALTTREKDHRDRYDRSLVFMDREIGRLLDSLNARGKLQNTLVIITADHGEQFGEHGLHGHSNSLYRPLLQVPLVIVMPGTVPAGVRVTAPVSLRDVASTIADLVGANAAQFGGSSLRRAWNGQGVGNATIFAETNPYPLSDFDGPVVRGAMKTIVSDGQQYIRNGDAVEELYDVTADPYEVKNLAPAEQNGRLPVFRKMLQSIHLNGVFQPRTWTWLSGR